MIINHKTTGITSIAIKFSIYMIDSGSATAASLIIFPLFHTLSEYLSKNPITESAEKNLIARDFHASLYPSRENYRKNTGTKNEWCIIFNAPTHNTY